MGDCACKKEKVGSAPIVIRERSKEKKTGKREERTHIHGRRRGCLAR